MTKLVTVVIPCYNQARYLEETVASVMRSSHPLLEVIVVDDGSTDDSAAVARRLEATHPNLRAVSQENQGPSVARNRGIRLAAGQYILPLDADDLIAEDYIAAAAEVLDADPEVRVVYCEAEFFGGRVGPWKLKSFSLDRLAVDNMIFVSALFRKVDWERCGGFAPEMKWGYEDWEFWISMLKSGGKVVRLPFTGFYYRVSPTSRRKMVTKAARRRTVDFINRKHPDFIRPRLGGPLHYQRSWSSRINRALRLLRLGR